MKILCLSQLLMPDAVGGTGRVARNLADGLIQGGNEVVALTQALSDDVPKVEVVDGLEIRRYGSPQLRRSIGLNAAAIVGVRPALTRVLASRDFDSAVTHQPFVSVAAATLLHRRRVPDLRFFYASGAQERERGISPRGPGHLKWMGASRRLGGAVSSVHWQVETRYVREATHLCFLSHFSQRLAMELHGPDLPDWSVIPAGVDTSVFSPSEDRTRLRTSILGTEPHGPILFTARNLTSRMGIDALIDAMPAILDFDPSVRLFIAGDGALRGELGERARRAGVDRTVRFLGRVSDEDLVTWYRMADIFVLPTIELEGFGMVTAEALACGTPVVATPIAATPELLAGSGAGVLAASAQSRDIARAIIDLLANVNLESLRPLAREHALEHFDGVRQAASVARLLGEIVNRARSRSASR